MSRSGGVGVEHGSLDVPSYAHTKPHVHNKAAAARRKRMWVPALGSPRRTCRAGLSHPPPAGPTGTWSHLPEALPGDERRGGVAWGRLSFISEFFFLFLFFLGLNNFHLNWFIKRRKLGCQPARCATGRPRCLVSVVTLLPWEEATNHAGSCRPVWWNK